MNCVNKKSYLCLPTIFYKGKNVTVKIGQIGHVSALSLMLKTEKFVRAHLIAFGTFSVI
jgi:hypothetical protein